MLGERPMACLASPPRANEGHSKVANVQGIVKPPTQHLVATRSVSIQVMMDPPASMTPQVDSTTIRQ